MSKVLALSIMRLLVALIVLECILAVFLPFRELQSNGAHVSKKQFSPVFWTACISSEEEKIEESSDKGFAVRITDLRQNFYFLSRVHTTPKRPRHFHYNHNDRSASILVLLCSLII